MLENPRDGRTRGRQAEAAANDERILNAALRVLIADPKAPITEVASEARVGVASLYRRFTNREDLAQRLALHAMAAVDTVADTALERLDADPHEAFLRFLDDAMEAGAGSMEKFAGTFMAGEDLNAAGARMHDGIARVLGRAQSLGGVRNDITALDVFQLFNMLRAVGVGDEVRDRELRRRYIAILGAGLRAQEAGEPAGAAPTWEEVLRVWNP